MKVFDEEDKMMVWEGKKVEIDKSISVK